MKKVLVIDSSSLFREYLCKKLEEQDFEVIQAANGLDGGIKLRNEMPDLVIMDYFLTRKSSQELLKEKMENPNVAKVPVIMVSAKIGKAQILEVSKYGINKFFSKPLKVDSFLSTISDVLGVSVVIDNTPCIIEAHFNDDILFIEVARGLNREKIELLGYKIIELLELYEIKHPKVLIMFSNMDIGYPQADKMNALLSVVLEKTKSPPSHIKILSSSDFLKEHLVKSADFSRITVTDNLANAMDDLIGLRGDGITHDKATEKLLTKTDPKKEGQESIELRFQQESLAGGRDISVAVVDDDFVIQELVKTVVGEAGWAVKVYENGKQFVDGYQEENFDLVFLDLMMPEMNGFEVLQHLKKSGSDLPVIVFSALSKQDTVARAISFGIKSYLIKPIKPDKLLRKAGEVLRANF
jgi:DNA-binding response OmpR family regulator